MTSQADAALPSIVVPVHNAAAELKECLASLKRTVSPGVNVLILDDASTDPEVRALIEQSVSGAGPNWSAEFLAPNKGFVHTANHGLRKTAGNVVLLNSDTVTTSGWLEGMARCLAADERIATATPWTNNGEIASIPTFCQACPVPELPDAVAEVIAANGPALYPELPTAVGFCMAIRRSAIDDLGVFDAERFGMGYGEENDFSMRASLAGWRNVLCDDVYVAHHGGSSFGPRGLAPDETSMANLLQVHPGYLEQVMGFIEADPLADRRGRLLAALQSAGIALS